MDVELDASLGIGYLARVESGKIKSPERDTLERSLAALNAPYMERRDILELFGYVVDTPLPTEAETQWAVDACRDELQMAVFPAYLLNCAHEMLVWNGFIPHMFRAQIGTSVLRMLFDPAYELNRLIANPDEFFPAQIRALRYEMRLMGGEDWQMWIDALHEAGVLAEGAKTTAFTYLGEKLLVERCQQIIRRRSTTFFQE